MALDLKDYSPELTQGALLNSAQIATSAVTAAKIASDAVTTAKILDANVTPAKTNIVQAVTATADGTGTGTIADTTTFALVTSANANNIVVLPTPTVGREVWLAVGATGYELRSSAPGTVAINGGAGANAESAIGANVATRCVCTSATTWICTDFAAAGTVTATEAAA